MKKKEKTKYKKGDRVMILEDLTMEHYVKSSWIDEKWLMFTETTVPEELVALSNDCVYRKDQLIPYHPGIQFLAKAILKLKEDNKLK